MSTTELLSFDAAAVEAWSAFSGDRNPIHFSKEVAQRLGASDIVVHGMLPLMYIQARCWAAGAHHLGLGGWRTWHARLKRPLLQNHEARLDLETSRGGIAFALVDRQDAASYICGRFEPSPPPTEASAPIQSPVDAVQLQPLRLGGELFSIRERAIKESFPEVAAIPWVRLSAVAFAAFLSDRGEWLQRAAVERLYGDGATLGDRLRRTVTVQTAQTVRFDADRLDAAASAGVEGCECTFVPVRVLIVGPCCFGSVEFSIALGGLPVMEMSVGMMMRGPSA